MASDRYFGKGGGAVGTDKTLLTLISAATVRPAIYKLSIGSAATPADQTTSFALLRFTAVGTEGSGWTPVAIDPSSPAALSDCGVGTFGAEPTYTASSHLFQQSVYQRAPFVFHCEGHEFVAPATANNGIGLKSLSGTGTAVHEVGFWFKE